MQHALANILVTRSICVVELLVLFQSYEELMILGEQGHQYGQIVGSAKVNMHMLRGNACIHACMLFLACMEAGGSQSKEPCFEST